MDSWKTKYLFPALGMIPIDRAGGSAANRALDAAAGRARRGELFGIYPEGTRSPRRQAPQGPHRRGPPGPAHRLPDLPGRHARHPRGPAARRRRCPSRSRSCASASAARSTSPATRDQSRDHLVLRQITDEVMFEIRELPARSTEDVRHQEGEARRRRPNAGHRHGSQCRREPARRHADLRRPGRPRRLTGRLGRLGSHGHDRDHDHAARRFRARPPRRRHRGRPGRVDRPRPGQGRGRRQRQRRRARPRLGRCPTATTSPSSPTRATGASTRCATRRPTCWPRPSSTLFPGATFSIGPPIENGFYYDFELPGGATFTRRRPRAASTPGCARSSPSDQPFVRDEIPEAEALELFADQPYKCEIIERRRPTTPTSATETGLVAHLPQPAASSSTCAAARTCPPRAGSATSSSCGSPAPTGAATRRARCCSASTARRGRRRRTSAEHLHRLEEAEKRDHRKLGAELDLFSFPDELGSGLAVWHPKGGHRPPADGGLQPPAPRAGRLRVRVHAPPHQGEPVRDVGPPRLVRRRHVPADGAGQRAPTTTSSR